MRYVPGLWMFIVAAIVMLALIVFNLARIKTPLGRAFLLLIGSALWWNVMFLFELSYQTLEMKLLFARLQFIGIALIPIAWLYLSLVHTARNISRSIWAVIIAVYAATMVFVFLIPPPNLFWGHPSLVVGGVFPTVDYDYGPWFHYILMPFTYILIAYALFILARSGLRAHRVYRKQFLLIITGTLIPAVVNILYVFDITPVRNVNFSTVTFSLTGILVGWALFRYRFLDLNPVARDLVFETMADAVVVLDGHLRILDANLAAVRLLGNNQSIIGVSLDHVGANGVGQSLYDRLYRKSIDSNGSPLSLGSQLFDITFTPIDESSGVEGGYLMTLHDVTERETLHRQIEEIARRDPLTGVFNRRGLLDRLDLLVDKAGAEKTLLSVIMLDIDHFKHINDTYGHEAGDRALETLSKIVIKSIRSSDIMGRFGGDEFIVILPECSHDCALGTAHAIHDAVGIQIIPSPFATFTISVSLGVVTVGRDFGSDGSESSGYPDGTSVLLALADKALYMAKNQGRDRVVALQNI